MAKKIKPDAYLELKEKHPEYMGAVEALGSAAQQAGPLDEKVTQLVQLSASAAIRSEGAVHSHARRALEAGVSAQEIHHALLSITSTIGFPNAMAALSWANDVIDNEKSRKKQPGKKKQY
ncbi:MAG: carboxymuconolactone decarboxylase family protein [Georgfuchsia sp.]